MNVSIDAKVGGVALIVGSAFYIVSTLIMPGNFVDQTNASDLHALTYAIADSPSIAGFAAVLGAVSLMFLLWGLIVMWQTAQGDCPLNTFVKFGLVGVMLATISLLMAQFLDYATSQVVEHGIGAGAGPDQRESLMATGLQLQSIAGAARLMAWVSGLMAYVVLGFALARKFRPGAHRILAIIVAIVAIVVSIGTALTEPFPDLMDTLDQIFMVLSMLYLVWWSIIGFGVYQGRFGLRLGVTPEH